MSSSRSPSASHATMHRVPVQSRRACRTAAIVTPIIASIVTSIIASFVVVPAPVLAATHEAVIQVERRAPFIELPMTREVYRNAPGPLRERLPESLRVVDANGQPVPHAWLGPERSSVEKIEHRQPIERYAMPPRGTDGVELMPIEITISGNDMRVQRSGTASNPAKSPNSAPVVSPGVVFDLGPREQGAHPPSRIVLEWSAQKDFEAGYRLETSEDLSRWSAAGAGRLVSITAADRRKLAQRELVLPPAVGRFVLLRWDDAGNAPALSASELVRVERRRTSTTHDSLSRVSFDARASGRAAVFDLGGLPVDDLQLRWTQGTRVVPALVQVREDTGAEWRTVGSTIFSQVDRDGVLNLSPAWTLGMRARELRLMPEEQSVLPDIEHMTLEAGIRLPHLVFTAQGDAPWKLQLGAADAQPLSLSRLLPDTDAELSRLGSASLGAWQSHPVAAKPPSDLPTRTMLLWAVLVAGVAVLGFFVLRLARATGTPPTPGR